MVGDLYFPCGNVVLGETFDLIFCKKLVEFLLFLLIFP